MEESQFTEVTGPGGIHGATEDEDPIWATGWDERSVKLKLRHHGRWSTFRLPKASFTYDGKHGWHTEWPRIREIDPRGGSRREYRGSPTNFGDKCCPYCPES